MKRGNNVLKPKSDSAQNTMNNRTKYFDKLIAIIFTLRTSDGMVKYLKPCDSNIKKITFNALLRLCFFSLNIKFISCSPSPSRNFSLLYGQMRAAQSALNIFSICSFSVGEAGSWRL